jgi:hypothetical protein
MSFRHIYQEGTSGVEIFSPSGTNPFKSTRIENDSAIHREYDRSIKGYIVSIISKDRSSTNLHFPKNQGHTLGLSQRYLCFQLLLFKDQPFSIDLVISDSKNCRRRVTFSTAQKSVNVNNLHLLFPLDKTKLIDNWLTLVVDLLHVSTYDSDAALKSLDSIVLYPNCKLRKIYTLPDCQESFYIPTSWQFPKGIETAIWQIPEEITLTHQQPPATSTLQRKQKTSVDSTVSSFKTTKDQPVIGHSHISVIPLKKQVIPQKDLSSTGASSVVLDLTEREILQERINNLVKHLQFLKLNFVDK